MSFDNFNKIAGAVIGSLLVFLLLGFFSGKLYGTREAPEEEPLAFALAVEEETEVAEAEEAEAGPDLAMLVANADPAEGEAVFRQCQACHQVQEEVNGVGPHLKGVVGREIAAIEGFGYSDALMGKEGVWDVEALSAFLENPSEWAPGTIMGYSGLAKAEDRVNLIAWMNEQADEPADLAALAPEPEAAPEEDVPAETGDQAAEADAETAAAGEAEAEEAGGQYADLLAAADPGAGESAFRQCQACHKAEQEVNGVGPHLVGVMGREIASVDGYSYSDALSAKEGAWTLDKMMAWLEDPNAWAPGNKMGYALEDAQTRMNIITWLNEVSPDPVDLGGADRAAAEEPTETETAAADTEADMAEPQAGDTAAGEDSPGETTSDGDAAADDTADASGAGGDAAADEADQAATEGDDTEMAAAESGAADAGDGAEAGPYAELLANASAETGEQVFRQCQACHKAEQEVNGVGPHLVGVVGREIASVGSYNYSDALASKDEVWNLENLMAWLDNPGEFAAGNKMGYALRDAQQRIDVITYLNEADGSPEPLQ